MKKVLLVGLVFVGALALALYVMRAIQLWRICFPGGGNAKILLSEIFRHGGCCDDQCRIAYVYFCDLDLDFIENMADFMKEEIRYQW